MKTLEHTEKAILVACGPKEKKEQISSSLLELYQLAKTANAIVVGESVQYRDRYDATWLIGKGKVEEVAQLAEEQEADIVIFDQELSPAQIKHLERMLPCKVIDRTQLILDIFAQRAFTKEGRVQVELAQLEYLLPRLVGMGNQLSRLGAGIGTRGPGETKLETDRRHIRRQITECKKQLEAVRKHRKLLADRRKKSGRTQIALVGYTNAGKSTLLNQLTEAEVMAQDQLFATLDPTTRYTELPSGEQVFITDTVGFIRNLPHQIVAAFRSTLEQVKEADLLLHVVDASHPEALKHIVAVEKVLREIGADHIPCLLVLNKMDQVTDGIVPMVEGESIQISSLSDVDIVRLKQTVEQILHQKKMRGQAVIPINAGRIIAQFHLLTEVVQTEENDENSHLFFETDQKNWEMIPDELKVYVEKLT